MKSKWRSAKNTRACTSLHWWWLSEGRGKDSIRSWIATPFIFCAIRSQDFSKKKCKCEVMMINAGLVLSYFLVAIYVNFNIHAFSIFPISHQHLFRGEGDLFFTKTDHKGKVFLGSSTFSLAFTHECNQIRFNSFHSKFFTAFNPTKVSFQLVIGPIIGSPSVLVNFGYFISISFF